MRRSFLPLCHAFAAALGTLLLQPGAQAQPAPAKPATDTADAVAACERAAQQSLATKGVPPAELKFIGAPTVQPGAAGENRTVLRGAGSWRAATGVRKFDYTCDVDPRNPSTVGLVLRDTSPAPAEPTASRTMAEPDLRYLSPTACESSAAAALQKRWPGVLAISFDSSTRSVSQDSPARAELHGQGRALPAPGAPQLLFSFDCSFDPRDGRVLGTRISG